jgi:hypothetical protein
VAESRGNEEYVHLKSLEDEYEYMESNMPQKQPPPEEDGPPQSPNPAENGDGGGERDEGLGSPLGLDPEHWSQGAPSNGSGTGKRGYSGEDDHEEDASPPLSSSSHARGGGGGGGQRGNLWSSFGGDGSDWIPPSKASHGEGEAGLEGDPEEGGARRKPLPAGKRRPDLFESSPYPLPPKDHFPLGGEEEEEERGEKKSNQFDDEEEWTERDLKGAKWGRAAYEEGEDSPFLYYGTKTPPAPAAPGFVSGADSKGRRGDMKQWGSGDDID